MSIFATILVGTTVAKLLDGQNKAKTLFQYFTMCVSNTLMFHRQIIYLLYKCKVRNYFLIYKCYANERCKQSTKHPANEQKILYVDTEQSPYHCLKVMTRIFQLAGLPTETDCDRIQFLSLRKYTPDERIAIIETAIYRTEGLEFVLIDGIRDLVYDINSPSKATCIISRGALCTLSGVRPIIGRASDGV